MKSLHWLMMLTLLLAACASPQEPAAPAADVYAPMPYGNLAQVMRTIPFPYSNIIFDTQSADPEAPREEATGDTSGGATQAYANVYGGWPGVEASALALAETANLIMIPGRLCENGIPAPVDREDYKMFAQQLVAAGQAAYMGAQSKNLDTMVEVSGTVSEACEGCHAVYRDKPDEADRCKP